MKITVGTDIIEVERIKKAFENKLFAETIFTENEIEYCESKKKTKFEHYAARFAGKEAIFKAISKYLTDKYAISWKNVEILNDKNGRPYVVFSEIDEKKCFDSNINIKKLNIDISLSHLKDYAIATVNITLN